MYFSCTITSLFVWEGKAKEKSLFSFSFLFCFLSATYFVLWRPVLMYVRSLLFDNKPDFYFVSCTSVSLLVLFVFFFFCSAADTTKNFQEEVNSQAFLLAFQASGQRSWKESKYNCEVLVLKYFPL